MGCNLKNLCYLSSCLSPCVLKNSQNVDYAVYYLFKTSLYIISISCIRQILIVFNLDKFDPKRAKFS